MRGCLATSHARHGGICRLHSSGVSGRFYCSSRVNNNSNTQPHAWLQMDRASVLSRPVLPLTHPGNVVRGVYAWKAPSPATVNPVQAHSPAQPGRVVVGIHLWDRSVRFQSPHVTCHLIEERLDYGHEDQQSDDVHLGQRLEHDDCSGLELCEGQCDGASPGVLYDLGGSDVRAAIR